MLVGYARVSTADQSVDLQVDALKKAGCERVVQEVASGKNAAREQLVEVLAELEAGDEFVVWKLDRLGRSLSDILTIVDGLRGRGVGFRSLTDGIHVGDKSNPMGKAMLQLMGVFAELERSLMLERTHAGLAAARARGRVGGRAAALSADEVETIKRALEAQVPVLEIANRYAVSKVTIYKIKAGTYAPVKGAMVN